MGYEEILLFIGGVCMFLFGMQAMGEGLEKSTGNYLKTLLEKLTANPFVGFLLGAAVTAVIQSSSATTVMLVGFVNSGIMTLRGAIPVIMGSNVGTTITSWVLSLAGIEGGNFFTDMLKPVNFTAILALVGVIFYVFLKSARKKDIGLILLGFSVLIYGMDIMSGAVSGLRNEPAFVQLFETLSNPILGVLAGALVTAIIQSSSASVGILQSLTLPRVDSVTGLPVPNTLTYSSAIPIIMGQNIGTCVTALISSFGANKNAKRVAVVHLSFNIIGTVLLLCVYSLVAALCAPVAEFLAGTIDASGIAVVHTAFNLICTAMLLPAGRLLEKLSYLIVREKSAEDEKNTRFDDRLLVTPAFAIDTARKATVEMANTAKEAISLAISALDSPDPKLAAKIRELETRGDRDEDEIGSYLLKIASQDLTPYDSREVTKLLHSIGDLERLSDHAVNILESAEEMAEKKLTFSDTARAEIGIMIDAVTEIVELAVKSYDTGDTELARTVEPLEEVIDKLQSDVRISHIGRLKDGECTVELGFVLSDLLTNLERISDHCSNIAGCVVEISHSSLGMHSYTEKRKVGDEDYDRYFDTFSKKYSLVSVAK